MQFLMLGSLIAIARGFRCLSTISSTTSSQRLLTTTSRINMQAYSSDRPPSRRISRDDNERFASNSRQNNVRQDDFIGDDESSSYRGESKLSRFQQSRGRGEFSRSSRDDSETRERRTPIEPLRAMTDEEIIFVKANFRSGMPIKVKIVQFGPLGASVSINDGIARGLVLQREIAMLRDKRNGEDVVLGDELDAWVAQVREDGKINVALRPIGIDRISIVKQQILEAIEGSPDGIIPIGDKSSPQDISSYLHGVSKADFRKAVGSLYKERVVVPEDFELRLLPSEERGSVPATNIDINKIRDGAYTVFIGNLPVSVNEKILSNAIDKVLGKSKLVSLRMPLDSEQKTRGFAFVSFDSEEVSQQALVKLKGYQLMGRSLRTDIADTVTPNRVASTYPKAAASQSSVKPPQRVSNDNNDDMSLEDLMQYGNNEGSSRVSGTGSRASSRPEAVRRDVVATLYVGNLAYGVDESILKSKVESVTSKGSVVECRIATDRDTGRKKGFGYVDMWNSADADLVLERMNGMEILGRAVRVDDATR